MLTVTKSTITKSTITKSTITKSDLQKLILEVYKSVLKEQESVTPAPSSRDLLKQNAIKHLRMLKLLKATVSQVGTPPEIKKMTDEFKKTNTSTFIQQVLGLKDDISIRTKAILENPIKVVEDIIDEIIKQTVNAARQKLVQEKHELEHFKKETGEKTSGDELPSFFHGKEEKMEKHKLKDKKHHVIPKPILS